MSDARITKHELLDLAKAAVADRGLNYGKPEDNFTRIAHRWRAHIFNRFGKLIELDAASVAIMCMDLKMARLENTPHHLDSWVDAAGYAACGANIAAEPTKEILADRAALAECMARVSRAAGGETVMNVSGVIQAG